MLLRTCFLVLFIAVVADAIIHAAMGLGAAALHRAALVAASAEIVRGTTALQESIALHSPIPAPTSTCVVGDANGCTLLATTQIATSPPSSEPSPLPCPNADCTAYAQGNNLVDEGRIIATISTAIAATDGTVLARRATLVTFRTLTVPPYAALVGSLDETLGAIGSNGIGDDGGTAPHGIGPGTLIDVLDRNANSGTLTPANVWVAHVQNAASVTPAWEP